MTTHTAITKPPSRASQYWALTKPRVVQLIVFCALIGMVLAVPGLLLFVDRYLTDWTGPAARIASRSLSLISSKGSNWNCEQNCLYHSVEPSA